MPDPACELSIVMPVYNESAGIDAVVNSWTTMLDRLVPSYELRLYNDGSTDATGEVLDRLAQRSRRLVVVHQANRGHGPTILRGYREAVGAWVFQTDSDDEIPAEMFERLWVQREGQDVVFGIRSGRESPTVRRVITAGAALTVRALFGPAPRDVNVPFRLIRRSALDRLLGELPDDLFAPNVAISGLAARYRLPFAEIPVSSQNRRTGISTLVGIGTLFRIARRVVRETVRVARRDASGRTPRVT